MAVKFYITINDGTEFEVFPNKYEPFIKDFEDGEMFYRYKWGSLEFENKPFLYNKTSNSAYLIYTTLNALQRYDEIFIRFYDSDSEIEIKGYCGIVDGQLKNDKVHKVITITPVVIDKYTNLLENYKEKVDVLNGGDKNKIINGDFESWNGNVPVGWDNDTETLSRYYINDSYVLKLDDYTIASEDAKFNRKISIELISTEGTKYLIDEYLSTTENKGKWLDSPETYIFSPNLISLFPNEITSLYYYRVFSEPIPLSGMVTIKFYSLYGGYFSQSLFVNKGSNIDLSFYYSQMCEEVDGHKQIRFLLDNVLLKVNTTPYKTINIDFINSYLQSYPAFTETNPLALGVKNKHWDDSWDNGHELDGYFELTTGAPSSRFLSDGNYAPNDIDNLRLGDYEDIFNNYPDSKYYKCQISEATIYHCGTYNTTFSYKHRMRATAVFSRDEAKIKDVFYTQQDFEDGKCEESDIGVTLVPPAKDVGWVKTGMYDANKLQLWVRKPFNDENDTLGWELGDQINGGKFQGYDTQHRRTTKRIYPIDTTKSKIVNTCVDLRDTIKILFNQTHPDYATKNVISTFFWNDLEEEFVTLQGNNSGLNYVNNKVNFLNNIAVLHTLDLKKENTETQQQEGTFKVCLYDFLEDLKLRVKTYKYGQLYWWLTDNLDLRIEHTAYFDNYADINGNVLNYTTQPIIQEDYHDEFEYEPENMPKKIMFDQINSGYPDFTANTIKFDRISSSKRYKNDENVIKNKCTIITTDLKYCIENAENLDEGLILINYNIVGDQFVAAYGDTQIQGTQILNGNLSLSSILNNFALREGTYINGNINDKDVLFYNTTYSKKGIEFTVKGIIDNRFFDTNIDRAGMVKTLTHDFENQITKITLMYRIKSGLIVQDETEGLMFLNLGI